VAFCLEIISFVEQLTYCRTRLRPWRKGHSKHWNKQSFLINHFEKFRKITKITYSVNIYLAYMDLLLMGKRNPSFAQETAHHDAKG